MTGYQIRLALCRLITVLYVKKLFVLDGGSAPRLNRSARGLRGDYLESFGFVLFR